MWLIVVDVEAVHVVVVVDAMLGTVDDMLVVVVDVEAVRVVAVEDVVLGAVDNTFAVVVDVEAGHVVVVQDMCVIMVEEMFSHMVEGVVAVSSMGAPVHVFTGCMAHLAPKFRCSGNFPWYISKVAL